MNALENKNYRIKERNFVELKNFINETQKIEKNIDKKIKFNNNCENEESDIKHEGNKKEEKKSLLEVYNNFKVEIDKIEDINKEENLNEINEENKKENKSDVEEGECFFDKNKKSFRKKREKRKR